MGDSGSQSDYIKRLRRKNATEPSSQGGIENVMTYSASLLPMPPTTSDIRAAMASKGGKKGGGVQQPHGSHQQRSSSGSESKSVISDPRQQEHFAGVTFSMYKRTQVKKSLVEAMTRGAIEEANYWGAELICCGCFLELWEVLFEFMSRNIGMSNPKMPVIVEKCFHDFKDAAMSSEFATDQLGMRNSSKVRKLMAKVISIMCTSRKRGKQEYVKIDKDNDFDILSLSRRLKASSADYGRTVLRSGDPTEIAVAINEFCYHISKDVRNPMMANYWIEWLLEFDKRCRKKKERCQCERRDFAPGDDDGGKDPIFVIWDALLQQGKTRTQRAISTIMSSVLALFNMRFTSSVKKRRRHLLYFAVGLLCEPLDLTVSAIQNETALKSVLENLDIVYAQVKHGEVTVAPELPARRSTKQNAELGAKEKAAAHKLGVLLTMGVDDA